jgi:hypothetical protein
MAMAFLPRVTLLHELLMNYNRKTDNLQTLIMIKAMTRAFARGAPRLLEKEKAWGNVFIEPLTLYG